MGNVCLGPALAHKNGFFSGLAQAVPTALWKSSSSSPSPCSSSSTLSSNQQQQQQQEQEQDTPPPQKAPEQVTIPDRAIADKEQRQEEEEEEEELMRMKAGLADSSSSSCSSSGAQHAGRVLQHKTANLRDLYTLGRRLGQGQFGTTYMCMEKGSDAVYACKSIAKRKLLSPEDVEDVRREIQIMHHLAGHPNVVTIKGSYEDTASVHLVMELCAGGELFDRIIARGHYSERKAAHLTRTIVGVVQACHSLGVMHRDLKPENFLLSSSDEDSPLKATDFGLSVFFQPDVWG